MSYYHDSDDDVAWGPLDLREIEKTFKYIQTNKVNRRHTVVTKDIPAIYSQSSIHKAEEVPKIMEKTYDSAPCNSNGLTKSFNVTTSSSEYYTPNVTVNHEKSIPMTTAESSVYRSCDEINSRQTTMNLNALEDTQTKFLGLAERETNVCLDNFQQTLIQQSINDLPNCSSNNTKNSGDFHDSCCVDSFDSSKGSQFFEDDEIIVLSTDEENQSFDHQTNSEKSIGFQYEQTDSHQILAEDQIVSSMYNRYQTPSKNATQELSTSNVNKNLTIGAESPLPPVADVSPVQIPKIDLAAFDESDDCLELNNTLEEIERLLNTANDIENSSCVDTNSVNSSESTQSRRSPVNIISGSFILNPSANLISDQSNEVAQSQKKNRFVSKLAVPINTFRVPKTPTPVKSKSIVSDYKSVISPVGVYIKYSTKTPLVKHVKSTIAKNCFAEQPNKKPVKASNADFGPLPPVVYRPAKNKVYSVKENLLLPPSIDKLVKKSTVVKHEGRMNTGSTNKKYLEQKLQEDNDLTTSTIGTSLLNEIDQDVSVLACRQAFGK